MKTISPISRLSDRFALIVSVERFFSFFTGRGCGKKAWFLLVFFIFSGVSEGCNTPVFRYALEHWPAEDYRFVVLVDGHPSEELRQKVESMRVLGANLDIRWIDVGKVKEGGFGWGWPKDFLPYAFLKAPVSGDGESCADGRVLSGLGGRAKSHGGHAKSEGDGMVVWEGSPEDAELEFLGDSPARKKVAERILAGESAVFLVIERGNAAKMMAVVRRLDEQLRLAERTVTLSKPLQEGKISAKIPLQMKFSVLVLSANDPKEKLFVSQVMQLRGKQGVGDGSSKPVKDLWEIGEDAPLVVPVIGRGRAVSLLRAQDLDGEEIRKLCSYIAGPCSCEVKRQNPGADLLFAVDWVKEVEPVGLEKGSVSDGQNAATDYECKLTCLEPLSEEKKPVLLRAERKPYEQ